MSSLNFDLVVPTFRRPEKVIRFIKSFLKADHEFVKLYIYFDNRDSVSFQKVLNTFGTGSKHDKRISEELFSVRIMSNPMRAFRIWNWHLSHLNLASSGLFYICDDTELDHRCLIVAIDELVTMFNLDGVVGINQENIRRARGEKGFCLAGMGVLGRDFISRFPNNQVFCPDYVSFKSDAELYLYAKSIRKFHASLSAKLIHYHPRFFNSLLDETHILVRDKNSNFDKKIFAARQEKGFLWGNSFDLICKERTVENFSHDNNLETT